VAGAFRAASTAGDLQAATTTSLSITVPSSGSGGTVVAGDYAVITVEASGTTVNLTTPSGWTLTGGPYRVKSSVWLLEKSLVSGDVGASVSLAFSSSVRCDAACVVASSVQGPVGGSFRTESVETSAPSLPSTSGVPAGAFLLGVAARSHNGTTAASIGLPTQFTTVASTRTAFSTSPQQSIAAGWMSAATAGTYSGGTASSSPTSSGANFLLWLAPGIPPGSGATAPAATAHVTASANAGDASGTSAAQNTAGNTWPPDPYRQLLRSGGMTVTYTVSASLGGAPVQGAQGLAPTGGTWTDTTKAGVRRTLNLELAPDESVYDLLSPLGTRLSLTAHISANSMPVVDIPCGVYVVGPKSITVGAGKMSITAPDKWRLVQRARFLAPQSSSPGMLVTDQIASLLRGALGSGEGVTVTASSTATVPALTWDRDRDKAITDLAASIGAWVYFDRNGGAVVADIPTLGTSADWTIDAGATGVLISLDRQTSPDETYNVVVAYSNSATASAFPPQYVFDGDPNSPTYAGTDPLNNPAAAGPLGVVPIFYTSPVLTSAQQALQAAQAILSRTVGQASQVSISTGPNPAMDAFQVIDVLPPGSRTVITGYSTVAGVGGEFGTSPFGTGPFGGGDTSVPILATVPTGVLERHVADTLTHPLMVESGSPLHIDGRSTRADPYVSDVSA
jgi:hypothetical protein